jgi:hypothetical protein
MAYPERLLAQVLNDKFGQFLEGLSANNLKVGLWEGSVKLKNVKVKKTAFDLGAVPLKVKSGNVSSLELTIPWSALSRKSVVLEVHGVSVTVESQSQFKGEEEVRREIEDHLNSLKMGEVMRNAAVANEDGDKKKGQDSFVSNLAQKIVENMIINVSDVSITYIALGGNEGHSQTGTVAGANNGSGRWCPTTVIGVGVERLSLQTVDEQNKPVFLNAQAQFLRRQLVIKDVSSWFKNVDQLSAKTSMKATSPKDYITHPVDLSAILIKNTNTIAVPTSPYYSVNVLLGSDEAASGKKTGLTVRPWQFRRACVLMREVKGDARRKRLSLLQHKYFLENGVSEDPVVGKWRFFGAAMRAVFQPSDGTVKQFIRTLNNRRKYIDEYKHHARRVEEQEKNRSSNPVDVPVGPVLHDLEKDMPVAAVLNFRTAADAERAKENLCSGVSKTKKRPKSTGEWLSSFFTTLNASEDVSELSDSAFQTSNTDDLHDAMEDDKSAVGEWREDKSSKYDLNFDFKNVVVQMLGEDDGPLLTISMGGKGGVKHYPSKNEFAFNLSTFTMEDGYTTGTMFPHFVSPLPGVGVEETSVLELAVTSHAEEQSNLEVAARLLPLQIVWTKECFEKLNEVFDPRYIDGDVYDAASKRVQQFVADQQDRLNEAWASRKRIVCHLEISAPRLVIPLDVRDPDSYAILCELGNLGVTSEYKTVDPVGDGDSSSEQQVWFQNIFGVRHGDITKSSIVLEHWTGKLHGVQLTVATVKHLQSNFNHSLASSNAQQVYKIMPAISTSFDLYMPRFIGGKIINNPDGADVAFAAESKNTDVEAHIGTVIKAEMPEFEVFVFANLAKTFSEFQDLLLPKPTLEIKNTVLTLPEEVHTGKVKPHVDASSLQMLLAEQPQVQLSSSPEQRTLLAAMSCHFSCKMLRMYLVASEGTLLKVEWKGCDTKVVLDDACPQLDVSLHSMHIFDESSLAKKQGETRIIHSSGVATTGNKGSGGGEDAKLLRINVKQDRKGQGVDSTFVTCQFGQLHMLWSPRVMTRLATLRGEVTHMLNGEVELDVVLEGDNESADDSDDVHPAFQKVVKDPTCMFVEMSIQALSVSFKRAEGAEDPFLKTHIGGMKLSLVDHYEKGVSVGAAIGHFDVDYGGEGGGSTWTKLFKSLSANASADDEFIKLSYAAPPPDKGIGSLINYQKMAFQFSRIQVVYFNYAILEVVDYLQVGVLGSIMANTASNIAAIAMEQMGKTEDLEVDIIASGTDLLIPQQLGNPSSPCIALLSNTTAVNFTSSQTKSAHRRTSKMDAFSIVTARMEELRVLTCENMSRYKDDAHSKMVTNAPVVLDVCIIDSSTNGHRRLDLKSLRNTSVATYFLSKKSGRAVAGSGGNELNLDDSSYIEMGDSTSALCLTKQYTIRATVSSLAITMYRKQYQLLMQIVDDNVLKNPSNNIVPTRMTRSNSGHIVGTGAAQIVHAPKVPTVDFAFQSKEATISLAQIHSGTSSSQAAQNNGFKVCSHIKMDLCASDFNFRYVSTETLQSIVQLQIGCIEVVSNCIAEDSELGEQRPSDVVRNSHLSRLLTRASSDSSSTSIPPNGKVRKADIRIDVILEAKHGSLPASRSIRVDIPNCMDLLVLPLEICFLMHYFDPISTAQDSTPPLHVATDATSALTTSVRAESDSPQTTLLPVDLGGSIEDYVDTSFQLTTSHLTFKFFEAENANTKSTKLKDVTFLAFRWGAKVKMTSKADTESKAIHKHVEVNANEIQIYMYKGDEANAVQVLEPVDSVTFNVNETHALDGTVITSSKALGLSVAMFALSIADMNKISDMLTAFLGHWETSTNNFAVVNVDTEIIPESGFGTLKTEWDVRVGYVSMEILDSNSILDCPLFKIHCSSVVLNGAGNNRKFQAFLEANLVLFVFAKGVDHSNGNAWKTILDPLPLRVSYLMIDPRLDKYPEMDFDTGSPPNYFYSS